MNENIIPFSYRRIADKKRAFPLFFVLIGISVALVISYMISPKYRGVIGLVAICAMTAAMMVYLRYVISDYTYSVREGEDNQAFLIFTKIVGKRQSMMGCVPLYAVQSIEKFTKEELKAQKIDKGTQKYNFAPTFSPDVVYAIRAQKGSVKYFVVLEGTDDLRNRILEYSRYALLDKASLDADEEEY